MLAFGVMAALYERGQSGKGQVIDAAMTDGSALLMNSIYGLMGQGVWHHQRGTNLLDGGAHFYGTYETKDGKFVSIGSIEPQFYALLLEKTGLADDPDLPRQMSRNDWPALKEKFAAVMASKTRDEWDAIMLGTDICYAPILNLDEAAEHPTTKSGVPWSRLMAYCRRHRRLVFHVPPQKCRARGCARRPQSRNLGGSGYE